MAIGFMRCPALARAAHFKCVRAAVLMLLFAGAPAAFASEVSLIGVFPGRGAVMIFDAGAPQTVRIGQKVGGVTLVSVDKTSAVIDDAGRRRTLAMGQHVTTANAASGGAQQVTLTADGRGHFV